MTGRTGLTWVTALTVASLLLGGGAINALAEGRGGGHGGGGGQGNSGHQQQQQQQTPNVVHKDDGKPQNSAQPTNKHEDNDVERHQNDNGDEANDDLVTRPDRVTDEVRPGKGCGDQNHEHERNDECKHKEDADDENDDDANVATVASAGVDDMTSAVVDDRDDN